MTNYEKFKTELIRILANDESLAVRNGKPGYCGEISCECCEFRPEKLYVCGEAKQNWLNAEYIEKPKLTQREWYLCKVLETGWIARNEGKSLYRHETKPYNSNGIWYSPGVLTQLERIIPGCFDFIRYENAEPWSIEELLKLEVEE